MRRFVWYGVAVLFLVFSPFPAGAGLIIHDFTTAPTGYTIYADTGYAIDFDGSGYALFTKSAGTGPGWARFVSDDPIVGDFTLVTLGDRFALPGPASLGLALYYTNTYPPPDGTSFASVEFNGMSQFYSWIWLDPVNYNSAFANDNGGASWLRIRREGSTIYGDYCVDAAPADYAACSFVTLTSKTDAALAAPVHVGLFLGQQLANTEALSGRFDILALQTPDTEVPEPAACSLLGLGLVLIGAHRLRRR